MIIFHSLQPIIFNEAQIKWATLSVKAALQNYTGRFLMFSEITIIYNKKIKGPTLMELFTATGKLKTFF
jgi:hypothetical protein